MLEKLMEKKKKDGKELDPMYKDSKMSMLKALRQEMSGLMKDDLTSGGVKEVALEDAPAGEEEIVIKPEGEEEILMGDNGLSDSGMGSPGVLSPEEIEQLEMLLAKMKRPKGMMV